MVKRKPENKTRHNWDLAPEWATFYSYGRFRCIDDTGAEFYDKYCNGEKHKTRAPVSMKSHKAQGDFEMRPDKPKSRRHK